jgi:hypothetical protein
MPISLITPGRKDLDQDHWRKVRNARSVLCRLMVDIMRTVHGAYA